MAEWIWATRGDSLGISVRGYGVLTVRSGDLLGVSVSGHGDLGNFGPFWRPIGQFEGVSTFRALPWSP